MSRKYYGGPAQPLGRDGGDDVNLAARLWRHALRRLAALDTLQTMPGAETATESLASPSGIEVPVGAPYTTRSLRLRRANREDVIRVPARLENWLPPDHPARRVWKTVEGLDLVLR